MKALRILRSTLYSTSHNNNNNHTSTASTILRAFFSAQPQHEDPLTLSPHSQPSESDSVFDSSHYEIHEEEPKPKPKPTWDEKYRARADQLIFGEDGPKGKLRLKEEEDERRRRVLAKALLEAALDKEQEEEEEEGVGVGVVKEEDQKSLSVGIIGAPNAGKSALTNYMEIPYDIEHRLIDWKDLRDGSLRIEQHFITHKFSQRKILVERNGSKIGEYQTSSNRLVFVSTNKQIQCERGIMSHGHSAPKLIKGTCISLLKSCKSLWQLKQIQTLILSAGLQQDRDTLNKLMASCMDSSVQDFHYALRIFNHIQQPSLFIYNLMIKAFVKRGSFRSAISLFKQLREDDGVWPDNYTYPYVFKAIGCVGEVGEGEKVHAFVIKTGLEFDSYVCNSLMDMYAELGCVGGLKQLFEEMPERDSVSWNIMISGCVRCRRFHEAVEVFQRMQIESNQKPNEATVVSTLTACAALRNVEVGKEIHSYIARELDFTTIMGNALLDTYCKCGYVSVAREIFDGMTMKNVNCWTSVVTGYVNCGELDQARDLFEKSPTRDVVLWTAMINGYVQFNRFDEAIALFGEMQIRGVKPDKFIVVALLTGCAQLGALEHGRWIHDYVHENRIMVDAVVGTALIEMYAKCGCIEKSLEVFNGLKEKDTASWTSIICGLAMNGKTNKALKLFEEMKTFGAKPDDVTFIAVLSACSHAGLVEEGRKLFHSMSSIYHIEPNLEHYGCFIDLLGRAGLLHEAEELVRKLPDQKNEIIVPLYGSLLSACRIYGNIDMGERLATTLAKFKSRDSSVHSLLASIYASADRWEDVNKVRSKMKDLGIRKLPGCSAIEVHGIGNRGGVGALSHFRTKIGLPTWDSFTLHKLCLQSLKDGKLGEWGRTQIMPNALLLGESDITEARVGEVKRVTRETNVSIKINSDDSGVADCSTGIPFLDHMLDQLALHGLFDVHIKATGVIDIYDHHTNEDVALAIGTALLQGLGDRKDLSSRPHLIL